MGSVELDGLTEEGEGSQEAVPTLEGDSREPPLQPFCGWPGD